MWQDRPNQWDNGLTQSFRSNSLSEFINCLLSLTRWILKLQVNMWYLYTVLCPMGLHILFFFYQSFTKLSRHNDKHIIVQVNFIWVIKLYIYIYIFFFFYRLFNSAELKTEGDTRSDGSIAKLWRLCTVQQLEGLKTLVRIFPIWSTGIFLSIPV